MSGADKFSPDTLIPFATYRTPLEGNGGFDRGNAEICPSVANFYFSERFRGQDESLRRELLLNCSASEARKIAQRAGPCTAWFDRRLDLVKAALWMQFRALPFMAEQILNGSLLVGSARSLGQGWEPRHRGYERWQRAVLNAARRYANSSRMSLLATGDPDVFNPFLFSSRLGMLLGDNKPNELIVCCRRGVDAMAELWAIEQNIPVIHQRIRSRTDKLLKDAIPKIVAATTHAFIVSKGEDKTVCALVTELAAKNIPTRIVRLDADGRPIPRQAPLQARS